MADPGLEDDENWPSTVQTYSVLSSPPPCLVDHCIQINEHALDRSCDGATLVIRNPTLHDSFQPASHTSIILKWWCSSTCYSYFGNVAYKKLPLPDAAGGGFVHGHVDSDDMEGQPKWDPLALETSWH